MLGSGAAWAHRSVQEMVDGGEGERVEFKQELPRLTTLLRDVVAFANTRGGSIVVGVRDDGRVVGSDADRPTLDALVAYVRAHTDPPIEITVEPQQEGNRQIVLINVPRSREAPVLVAGSSEAYVRVGATTRVARRDDLERLVLEAHPGSFEDAPVAGATVADLDEGRVRTFLTRRGTPADESALVPLLRNQGFLADGIGGGVTLAPTVAALLLFGKAPQRFLPQARTELARFSGVTVGPDADRTTIDGPLPEQIDGVLVFLRQHMRVATRVEGFRGKDVPEYPLEVVQELFTNALVHRDYRLRGMAIRVWLFHDRWEVTSPGRLPGTLTPASLEGGLLVRDTRNPRLAEAMRVLGYGDGLGLGLHRARRVLETAGLPPPRIFESGDTVTLTLSGAEDALRRTARLRQYNSLLTHAGGHPRQLQALEHLLRQPTLTNADYRRRTNVSEVTALRDLTELVERGVLVRHGAKRGAYYALADADETANTGRA